MNIELAPEEYHKRLTYEEAKLYCFSLNIDGKVGWRLPTFKEYRLLELNEHESMVWHTKWHGVSNIHLFMTAPVRDLS